MTDTNTKVDKVIVTNLIALKAKYGSAGAQKVQSAVQGLITADKKRGLVTRLYLLDNATSMKQVAAPPVTKATDPKQNKDAIDAIYKAFAPDYLMILGAVDVIPHQDLKNPMYSPSDDPDRFAFGDLPYACEAKYSQRPQDFFGPTRVVCRMPDITGTKDPKYLIALLNVAASYKTFDASSYRDYSGISAEIWKDSTVLSITNTFGNGKALKTVPPSKENWPSPFLGRLALFVNCHGAPNNSQFFGQPASGAQEYPVALDANYLNGKIKEGTVVAAECCYGGQLFNPAFNAGKSGISNTYLANKAYGFFGSTTIAYGPADGNDSADLICQYFLQSLLNGASLGRSSLEARQKFVHTASMYDPSNIKTIAQFNIYSDPSIVPIKPPHRIVRGAKAFAAKPSPEGLRVTRTERRRDLFSRGIALAKSQPIISKLTDQLSSGVSSALEKKAVENGITMGRTLTFSIKEPPISKSMPKGPMAKKVFPSRVYVIFHGGKTIQESGSKRKVAKIMSIGVPPVIQIVALIVKEVNGTIVSTKKIFSR